MSQEYLDQLERMRKLREAQLQASSGQNDPQADLPPIDEEGGFFNTAGDVITGVASGINKGVGDLYGVADFLTFDVLPDYAIDFGKRKTVWGNLAEGVSHFATAFVPVAGWIGRGGKVLGGFKTAGALSTRAEKLHKLNKARQAGLSGKAALAAGKKRGVNKISVGRDMWAGAIADNIIYNEDDQNLSSLLTQFPALEGTVLELLAVEEDDSEVAARLKVTMEGMGLGLLIDGVRYGVQRIRANRKITEANPEASPEEVAKKVDEEVGPPPEIVPPKPRAAQEELFPDMGDPVDQMDREAGPGAFDAEPEDILDRGFTDTSGSGNRLRERIDERLETLDNPRDHDSATLAENEVRKNGINLLHIDSDSSINVLFRATESLLRDRGAFKVGSYTEEMAEQEVKQIAGLIGTDPNVAYAKLTDGVEGASLTDQLGEIKGRTAAVRSFLGALGTSMTDLATKAGKGGLDETDLALAARLFDVQMRVVRDLSDLKTLWGQGLGSMKMPANAEWMQMPFSTLNKGDMGNLIDGVGGREGIEKALAKIAKVSEGGDSLAASKAATDLLAPTWFQTFTEIHQELYINSLIGGIKTVMLSGTGFINIYWKGVQRMFGASLDAADKYLMNSERFADGALGRESLQRSRSVARQEVMEAAIYIQNITFGARHHFMESMKFAGKAWKENNSQLISGSSFRDAPSSLSKGLDRGATTGNIAKLLGDPDWMRGDAPLGNYVMKGGVLALHALKWPSRAMVSFDEAAKQFQARATTSSKLASEYKSEFARLEQIGREGDLGTMPEYITKRLSRIIRDGQIISKKVLYKEKLAQAPKKLDEVAKQTWAAKEANRAFRDMEDKNGSLVKFVQDDALDTTFQTPIRRGGIAADAERLLGVNSQNALRRMGGYMVAPFRKTPVNIISSAMRHLDFMAANKFSQTVKTQGVDQAIAGLKDSNNKFLRQMSAKDPLQRAEALGRLATGFTLLSTATQLASEGRISGRGPTDRHERDLWASTGKMPYSFKTDKGWVSYQKMDPWATLLGMAADFQDVVRYSDDSQEEQQSIQFYFSQMFIALRSNVADKAYLKGISNIMEAVYSEGGAEVDALLRSTVAAHIPNTLGSLVRESNDDMKLVRTIGDAIRERIPGLSSDLPPRRNILGEPMKAHGTLGSEPGSVVDFIFPIAYHGNKNDEILTEMSNLGYPFSPPDKKQGPLDWNTVRRGNRTAYDYWTERTGTIKIDGMTLRQTLKMLIKSDEYQSLTPESTQLVPSPRIRLIKNMLTVYRSYAKAETIQAFPALMQVSEDKRKDKLRSLLGYSPTLN